MRSRERQQQRQLSELGFQLERRCGSGHLMFRHENGGRLVVPASPSDHRGWRNVLAEARRVASGVVRVRGW